jgi:4-amino-4-deoxy-L-arabinose transferase-like glycosyltransferase
MTRQWWAGAACAVAVLVAALATYVFVTPIGEQQDEYAHLHYAGLIAHNLALPTDGVQERQQPPLYYLLIAGVLKATGDDPHAARWVSVALTVLTALVLVVTLLVLMPRRPWLALAGLWVFALLPGVQYEGAQVSNDSLAWLAGALVLLVLVLTLRRTDVSSSHWAAVGAAIGIALMAKATVWPLAGLLLVAVVVRHHRSLRLRHLLALLAPVVAISGWWFARSLSTFGRLLPPMTAITRAGVHTLRAISQLPSWISLTWKSAVGIEGPQQTPLVVGPGRAGLYLLGGAGLVAGIAVLVATWRAIRSRQLEWDRPAPWLLAAPVLTVAFSLFNSVTLDNQPQARYLLVAATVWCGGLVWAVATLLAGRPRLLRALVAVALIGMVVLDAATVQTLRLLS